MKATTAYDFLLRCYPAEFRQQYAAEMRHDFAADWEKACGRGPASARRYLAHLAWDVCRTLPKEIFRVAPRAWIFIAAIALLEITFALSHPAFGLLGCLYAGLAIVSWLGRRLRFSVLLTLVGTCGVVSLEATRWIRSQFASDALVFTQRHASWGELVIGGFSTLCAGYLMITFPALLVGSAVARFPHLTPRERFVRAFLGKGQIALMMGWAAMGSVMTVAGVRNGAYPAAQMSGVLLGLLYPVYCWFWNGVPIPAYLDRLMRR